MSGDDEREGGRTPPDAMPAGPQYPAFGEVSKEWYLTACEALCWIGYRRAISKAVYFRPFVEAAPCVALEGRARLLHHSVPDPKPPDDPMGDAECALMKAAKAGQVRLLTQTNGNLEEVPSKVYDQDVSVNARGCIELNEAATERGRSLAQDYFCEHPLLGDVLIRTSEVLRAWPPPKASILSENFAALLVPRWTQEDEAPNAPAAAVQRPPSDTDRVLEAIPGPPATRPKATDPALRQWFRDRVASWPHELAAPSEHKDFIAASQYFASGFGRDDDFRPARRQYTPAEWRKQGPRLPWGQARQSAANPRNGGTQI